MRRKEGTLCPLFYYICFMKYFAYGSNTLKSRLEDRGVTLERNDEGEIAILNHYRIVFNKRSIKHSGEVYANIMPCWGDYVLGRVWDVLNKDIELLDKFDGYPEHYEKTLVPVQIAGSTVLYLATTYIATEKYTTPVGKQLLSVDEKLHVSDNYRALMLEGLRNFDEGYVNKVRGLIDALS